jgi:hypothetical protein
MFRRSLLSLSALSMSLSALDLGGTCSSDSCDGIAAFSPKEFRAFPVKRITNISHNTKAYEIEFPSAEHVMGLTVASLVMVYSK